MTNCPCCSHQLLRQIRQQRISWFCRHCWQEMPLLEQAILALAPIRLEGIVPILAEAEASGAIRPHDSFPFNVNSTTDSGTLTYALANFST